MHIWEELPRGLTVLPINVLGGETDSETCGHLFKVTQQLGSLGLDSDLPPMWTFEPEKAKCVPNSVLNPSPLYSPNAAVVGVSCVDSFFRCKPGGRKEGVA